MLLLSYPPYVIIAFKRQGWDSTGKIISTLTFQYLPAVHKNTISTWSFSDSTRLTFSIHIYIVILDITVGDRDAKGRYVIVNEGHSLRRCALFQITELTYAQRSGHYVSVLLPELLLVKYRKYIWQWRAAAGLESCHRFQSCSSAAGGGGHTYEAVAESEGQVFVQRVTRWSAAAARCWHFLRHSTKRTCKLDFWSSVWRHYTHTHTHTVVRYRLRFLYCRSLNRGEGFHVMHSCMTDENESLLYITANIHRALSVLVWSLAVARWITAHYSWQHSRKDSVP